MRKILIISALITCFSTTYAQDELSDNSEQEQPEAVLPKHDILFSFGDGMSLPDMEIEYAMGSYSLSYYYNIKRWLALGGLVSYSPQKSYNNYYNEDIYYNSIYYDTPRYRTHNLSLMGSVRFTYLNRQAVKLYSGGSLGFMHIFQNDDSKMQMGISMQMTMFGFSFGKKFYVGGEIGYGVKGAFSMNVGYKF
jgi:hypothetical protein